MIEWDEKGVLRFKANRIVRDVYDHHYDLNDIERRYQSGQYTFEEKYQFLALLGYSLDGFYSTVYQDMNSPINEED